jgi:hypothetical protein
MVRTEKYKPKTNIFGLDVAMFTRYFGCKAVGPEEPCGGVSPLIFGAISRLMKGAPRPRDLPWFDLELMLQLPLICFHAVCAS